MAEVDQRITRAVGGDVDALSELLRELGPKIRAQLSIDPRWQSVLEPDDVMQVTYLEAFLHIGEFRPGTGSSGGALFAWLKRVAENNLRDAVKALEAQKRPQPTNLSPAAGKSMAVSLLDLLGVTSMTPSRAVAVQEAEAAIRAALDGLPGDYSTVVQMYDLEGRSIADVAAVMKRSAGAVHMLRARAHDRLRSMLGPDSDYFSHTA